MNLGQKGLMNFPPISSRRKQREKCQKRSIKTTTIRAERTLANFDRTNG
uniref:Uncharacterized protein n=1 Tax=Rhizophora mucronata TaxID=61149 RepID=A0A2P2PB61_RHIMU